MVPLEQIECKTPIESRIDNLQNKLNKWKAYTGCNDRTKEFISLRGAFNCLPSHMKKSSIRSHVVNNYFRR